MRDFKYRLQIYLSLFLIISVFMYQAYTHSDELPDPSEFMLKTRTELGNPHARFHISMIKAYNLMTYEEADTFGKKTIFHKENADRCFREAEKMCMWLPKYDDRELAKKLLASFTAGILSGNLASKAVAAVVALFVQYSFDIMNEWNAIRTKLYWAEYHYEMYEFYKQLPPNQLAV